MFKMLIFFLVCGIVSVATIGLAGQGPIWMRYFGAGTVLFLLIGIYIRVNNPEIAQPAKKEAEGPKGAIVVEDCTEDAQQPWQN